MADEKKRSILHLEDEEEWRYTIGAILKKAGYTVIATATIEEARALIPDGVKDVKAAILDDNLKDGSGKTIATLLRNSNLPIAIIGLSTRETPWADEYVSKTGSDRISFKKNELLATLAKLTVG